MEIHIHYKLISGKGNSNMILRYKFYKMTQQINKFLTLYIHLIDNNPILPILTLFLTIFEIQDFINILDHYQNLLAWVM